MKALTVKQPWAWLIVNGHKTIEYRSWRTTYRGPLAIIASRATTRDTVLAANEFADDIGVVLPDTVDGGGIVGVVTLSDITGEPGDYEWHLTDPHPLMFVSCKGALGLTNIPDMLLQQAGLR